MQLYSSNYEWESAQDEQGMEAEKGHALAEAEALQIVLILIQQALVDKTWPCAWRLCLPSLLDTMLSSSMHGSLSCASIHYNLRTFRSIINLQCVNLLQYMMPS